MKDFFSTLIAGLGILIIILLLGGALLCWPIYKYKDCKRVGHSTLYCVLDFGK